MELQVQRVEPKATRASQRDNRGPRCLARSWASTLRDSAELLFSLSPQLAGVMWRERPVPGGVSREARLGGMPHQWDLAC